MHFGWGGASTPSSLATKQLQPYITTYLKYPLFELWQSQSLWMWRCHSHSVTSAFKQKVKVDVLELEELSKSVAHATQRPEVHRVHHRGMKRKSLKKWKEMFPVHNQLNNQLKMLNPIFSNPNMLDNLMFTRQLSSICQPCISQKPMSLYTASMQHQTFGFQDPVCNSSTKPQLWPTIDPRPYSFSTRQIYHCVV